MLFEYREPDSDERLLQFDLIADYLACTKARIGLNQVDTVLTDRVCNTVCARTDASRPAHR